MLTPARKAFIVLVVATMATACGVNETEGPTPANTPAPAVAISGDRDSADPMPTAQGALGPSEGAATPISTVGSPLPALRRLTEAGCCPLPFWSPDSSEVRFWNQPIEGQPGVYGIAIDGGDMAYVAERPVGIHRAGAFTTQADGNLVVLTRRADARVWRFDTGGESLVISPDESKAAWARELGRYVPGQSPPPLEHVMAELSSGETKSVAVPDDYALSSWAADGEWILFRQGRDRDKPAVIRYDPSTESQVPLFDGARLRSGRTSPRGSWLAVLRTMEENADRNGLYIVATRDGIEPRKIDLFGGYRWRDDGRLLVIPQESDHGPMTIWQVDPATGDTVQVWGRENLPIRVAAGEWTVSPDGNHLAFRSAADNAVWVVDLE